MRYLCALLMVCSGGAAGAFTCTFTTECYEAEACTEGAFQMEVDLPLQTVTTDFGDLEVVAIKRNATALVMFATGAGAEYMLTTQDGGARLATQTAEGPQSITYIGSCDGP